MNLSDLITKFLAYLLTERRASHNTYLAYKQDLQQFSYYCTQKKIELFLITETILYEFLSYLKDNGLTARSMARKVVVLRTFFAYCHEQYQFPDITQNLIIPKIKKTLPNYLTINEIEELFKGASKDTTLYGKRNSIMLYLMYGTGIRVSELISLTLGQIHRDTGLIAINGKRGRQRLVPIPDGVIKELNYYIDHIRPVLIEKKGISDYLFPVIYGKKIKMLTRQAFWAIVKNICLLADITRPVSPHTLRHSFATHLLNKGAHLRSLQLLLGHEQLGTVQIYTHIETSRLREIYDKKHPRSS